MQIGKNRPAGSQKNTQGPSLLQDVEDLGSKAVHKVEDVASHVLDFFHHSKPKQKPAPAPTPAPAPRPPVPTSKPAPKAPVSGAAEAAAVKQADGLWQNTLDLQSSFRRGERDYRDVNAPQDAALDQQATDQIKANSALESQHLQGLSSAQQADYQNLAKTTEADPEARLALQTLLFKNQLTGGAKASDGSNLLGSLTRLNSQATDPNIDRGQLVNQVVKEIATPSAINQQNKTTCTVTSLQMLTAMKNPAEYARIVGGLASRDGSVKLADGETLARQAATDAADGSGRSISSELWQPAFAQFALGDSVKWDNANDSRSDGKWGIFNNEVDHAADALSGKNARTMNVDDGDSAASIVQAIDASTKAGNPVPVCMDWGERDASGNKHPGHDVLFTRIENGQAYYNNPWGQEESMSVSELTQRVWWANFAKIGT